MIRILCILLFLLVPVQTVEAATKEGLQAFATASGEGKIVSGQAPFDFGNTTAMNGTISVRTNNIGDRWSALMNIDEMLVDSSITTKEGTFQVVIDEPLIHHPNGVDPTWFGVVYNQPMHGSTDTGVTALPKVQPAIAVWGWAKVYKNGSLIEDKIPAHVMVVEKGTLKGITMAIGVNGQKLGGTPDGHLVAHWPEIAQLAMPEQQKQRREMVGFGAILLLNIWFGWLCIRERRSNTKKDN
ncbi:hypothetical protein [Sediminibacillus massiliensis]|uniref:hypothetical protein n=1 Tax=Sediminibacillus massiliensis TaxID=1926277 RepID=UPI0009884083|nr:hypothetical protein [Sediminibacillus massiliensis]